MFGMQALAAAAPGNVLPLGGPKAGGKEGEVSGHLPQVANTLRTLSSFNADCMSQQVTDSHCEKVGVNLLSVLVCLPL